MSLSAKGPATAAAFVSALLLLLLLLSAPRPARSVPGNCAAGGSSHGVSFDWNRADTIGLSGSGLPVTNLTVEYWYRNTNLQSSYSVVHCYSAYNVRGFQGRGGGPYEAANEVQFGIAPGFLRLWRGTKNTDLTEKVNPRAATLTTEWRHYAFTAGSETAEVAFYVDGEMLDFGYASLAVESAKEGVYVDVGYNSMNFSSDWDVAEHPDAVPYYGRHVATAVLVDGEDVCSGELPEGLFPNAPGGEKNKTVALIWRSDECSDYKQAKSVAEVGAWAVIFEEKASEAVDEGDEGEAVAGADAGDGEGEGDREESPESTLSIPALSVSRDDFSSIASAGVFTFTRTRQIYKPGSDVANPIERTGVLHLGQEPDAPWGDFDRVQAANGVLDEYRVWSTVRTPEQIRDNYRRSIDLNSSDAADLAVYWKFDDDPALFGDATVTTPDSAPGNANPGLLGGLPTIKNQLQFVTTGGKIFVPPTSPDRILTSSSPLVGDGEVRVPVVPGSDAIVELKSFDPDGDSLVTVLTSVPSMGTLWSLDEEEGTGGAMLGEGDEVDDGERLESKRVVYRAPSNFASDVTFTYTVSDGGAPVAATVRLILHEIFQPESRSVTIEEDTLVAFSLSMPSQLDQRNMKVEITALPEKGRLYQAQFDPTAYPSWEALAKEVDQYGPMEKIENVGDFLNTDRGIVMYHPERDEHSSSPGEAYATFMYRFLDPSGLVSEQATLSVIVAAVNDPPVGVTGETAVDVGGSAVIALESTDVDADAAESFADRSFAKIVSFPKGGRVYQYDKELFGRGEFMDPSSKVVPQTLAWASRVVRFSSQFSLCGESCFTWKDPKCPMNDVLSGGRENGTCSKTAWHASMILGPPNFYPGYADTKLGWDLSYQNSGNEFIELEYPYPVYITGFELYQTFKPGSIWRISTTDNYIDDTERHCTGQDRDGVSQCTEDTEWLTLWTKPRESVTSSGETAQIMEPPLCPSYIKTRIVRLDLDTARVPGWNNFDAAKVLGSLVAPRGLLSDASNRFVHVPLEGVHGMDRLRFTVTDCLDESEEREYSIAISTPEAGVFSPSVFFTESAVLDTTPGTIVDYILDLTPVLLEVNARTGYDPMATGRVWHTTALAEVGDIYEDISLSNPTITIALGTETTTPSKLELWLEDKSGLTFRVHIVVKIHVECENGTVDESRGICVCTSPRWTGPDCSIEVSEDTHEIPPVVKGVGYAMFAVNSLIMLACLFGVSKNRGTRPVKAAQPFFLYMLLLGCLLYNSTIVVLQVEESDAACAVSPWLWSLGFSVMFGALFAKILRVYYIFKHGRAMQRRKITIKETIWPVIILLAVNAVILICWTAMDPLHWERTIQSEDGYGYSLSSYGQCDSENSAPYLASIIALNGFLMIVACYLSYKARHIPSEFQEGRNVSLAVFTCIEVYIIGVPVVVIVGSDPSISAFVQSAVIFLTAFAVLLLIFGPLMWTVYRGEREAELSSRYSNVRNSKGRRFSSALKRLQTDRFRTAEHTCQSQEPNRRHSADVETENAREKRVAFEGNGDVMKRASL